MVKTLKITRKLDGIGRNGKIIEILKTKVIMGVYGARIITIFACCHGISTVYA